jgi:two-component system sensor histidine kinase/response regulator
MRPMNIHPKILIVDDKPENLVALEVILKDLDVELVRATSGNEALKATLYHDFALALLDIQMPEMDGYELASILRGEEKTARLPFIFISAVYTGYNDVFKGYEQGAFSYLTKPFQPEILINKVKFFIEKHQQEIALYQLNEDLKEKNIDLEMINKELESFTYSVSHDLRAPLRAINGYAEVLQRSYEQTLDDRGKQFLGKVIASAERMEDLIEKLLAFSRIGRRKVNKTLVDMNDLVREALEEVCSDMSYKMPQVAIRELPAVQGDIELLRQVFINLLSNAFKYSSKKDEAVIEIGAQREGNEVIYSVKDNGAGFDMSHAGKLFGVFQRMHGSSEFEGTGVGLAIVQRIIEHHGGRVWAEAEKDKGATFSFALPAD